MIDLAIKKIISNFDGCGFIDGEESGSGTLYGMSVDYVDTTNFNEDVYDAWVDLLDSIDIVDTNFEIYASYDASGYDFWHSREESNYTYINIFINEDFCDEDFDSLIEELSDIIDKIDNFIEKNVS